MPKRSHSENSLTFRIRNHKFVKTCLRLTSLNHPFIKYSRLFRSLLESAVVAQMKRALAPLRRIVSRSIEVFEYHRNSPKPRLFAIHDALECGHTHASLVWEFLDLVNGYTDSPHVRANRHRCVECKSLTQRKPVQSVTLAQAKVA